MSESMPADVATIPPGRPPLLVVLSGPSGAGKDAVRDLLRDWGLPVHFAVTATNRAPRPNEVEGRDYLFLTDEAFDKLEADDGLIESALVYGQKKGVPRSQIEEPLAEGRDVLVRVDVQGAATLKSLFPEALLIFIAAPSAEEGERRLDERATETDDERGVRLEQARIENEAARRFDYTIVNETGQLEMTGRHVVGLIAAEKTRRMNAVSGAAIKGQYGF